MVCARLNFQRVKINIFQFFSILLEKYFEFVYSILPLFEFVLIEWNLMHVYDYMLINK